MLKPYPPQDAIYGISHDNIVAVLSNENWLNKAVVRVDRNEPRLWFYLWLRELGNATNRFYFICCVSNDGPDQASRYEIEIATLGEALACINGELVSDALALETCPAEQRHWPIEIAASFHLSGLSDR